MLSARRKAQFGLSAAGLVLGVCVAALIHGAHAQPLPFVTAGVKAPDFALSEGGDSSITLWGFRGKTVVLFFGSTQCPVSAEYNTRVTQLAREYIDNPRVQFLAINVTTTACDPAEVHHDPKVLNRFYPTLCDEKSRVADLYSVTQTPEFVIVDPAGMVRYRGAFDDNENEKLAAHHYCADAIRDIVGATATVALK
jgi:peroxiredoxin